MSGKRKHAVMLLTLLAFAMPGPLHAEDGKDVFLRDANTAMYVQRGMYHYFAYRYAEAIREFDRAIALLPRDPRAYRARAIALSAMHAHRRAALDYAHVIELEPSAEAYRDYAYTLQVLGRYAEALAHYDRSLQLDLVPWVIAERGDVHAKVGNYRRAVADYTEAIRVYSIEEPQHYNIAAILDDRAKAWAKLGNTAKAAADRAAARRHSEE